MSSHNDLERTSLPPSDEAAGNSSGRGEAVDWDLLLEEQADLWCDAALDPRATTEREQLAETTPQQASDRPETEQTTSADDEQTPLGVLHRYWGYPTFRLKQAEIIESVLAGRDTLGLLPTGEMCIRDRYRPIQKKQLCQTVRSTSVARCRRTSVRRDDVRIGIRARSRRRAVAEAACDPPKRVHRLEEAQSREPSYSMYGDLILTNETYQASRHNRPLVDERLVVVGFVA